MPTALLSFETEMQLDAFPPSIEVIEAHLKQNYPQQKILQWAITQSDSQTKAVWVEGSLISSQNERAY